MASTRALLRRNQVRLHTRSKTWSGIGGAIVTAVLTVFGVAFICIFLYEYRQGSRLTAQSGIPVHIGKIAKNAFLITLTLGLAGICSPKRFAERRLPATDAGRGRVEPPTHTGHESDPRQPPPISKY